MSRMCGAIPPLPLYVLIAWCLVKLRDNFTFTFTFIITLPATVLYANKSFVQSYHMFRVKGKVPKHIVLFLHLVIKANCSKIEMKLCGEKIELISFSYGLGKLSGCSNTEKC
jgi:hypothetical protein